MTTMFFQAGTSPVHRMNPVTKLGMAATVTVVAFAIQVVWLPAVLLLGVLAPAALVAGVHRAYTRLLLVLTAPVVVIIFLLQGLFFPEGTTVLAEFGVARVTSEGLMFATQTSLRLVVMLGSFLLLLFTTHPGMLMRALVERGMSPNVSYVISATLQVVPTIRATALNVLRAQQARGLSTTGVRRRVQALLPLVGPLLLGTLADLEERAVALEVRAFGSAARRTSLVEVPDSRAQRLARLAMAAVAVAAIIINVLGVVR